MLFASEKRARCSLICLAVLFRGGSGTIFRSNGHGFMRAEAFGQSSIGSRQKHRNFSPVTPIALMRIGSGQ